MAILNGMTQERRLNKVLTNTLRVFAKHNVKFNKLTKGDWIFHYNERQYASAMLPALLSECECVFVEQAVNRKARGKLASKGRIDYWAQYNDRTHFLIEIKQSYLSAKSGKLNSDYYLKWDALARQLKSIKKKEVWESLATPSTYDIYKIGIQTAYVYNRKKAKDKCCTDRADIAEMMQTIIMNKRINADWVGAWYTTDEPCYNEKYDTHFHYPACIWVVRKERLRY